MAKRFLAWCMALAACGGGRDVIPETQDVRSDVSAAEARPSGGYEFVARRPLGTVGLAEARGLSKELAEQATNTVADAMQGCMTELLRGGQLVQGAARVVARIAPDGSLDGLNTTVAPGGAVAHNAILCFIAPIKGLTFPPLTADPKAVGGADSRPVGPDPKAVGADSRPVGPDPRAVPRGLALEASWSPPH